MGLRGLTKFLETQRDNYFVPSELHDCKLVIDVGSLRLLFNPNFPPSNISGERIVNFCCYGGDYDKCERIFREFLKVLKDCNITPYFIIDGMKASDVKIERCEERLQRISQNFTPDVVRKCINPSDNLRYLTGNLPYPVGIKYLFADILTELKLNMVVTVNSENDNAAAQLSKVLVCPVLADDSDYFILGPTYIRLTMLSLNTQGQAYKYLPCKILQKDTLLRELNPRGKRNLHYLLPVLIGNDNNHTDLYLPVLQKHVAHKCIYQKQSYMNRIKMIFAWIKKQNSVEDAIKIIVSSFESKIVKDMVMSQIEAVFKEYSPVSVNPILKHFGFKERHFQDHEVVNFPELRSKLVGINTKFNSASTTMDSTQSIENVPTVLLDKELKGLNPSIFLEMLRTNRYLLSPNIDDHTQPDSNRIAYDIVRAIYQILVQDSKKCLTVVERSIMEDEAVHLMQKVLAPYEKPLPSVEDIEWLSLDERKNVLLRILDIDKDCALEMFDSFPGVWHIFLLAIFYFRKKVKLDAPLEYALILNFFVINYADRTLNGFYRSKRSLVQNSLFKSRKAKFVERHNENKVLAQMTIIDLKLFMLKIVSYYEMSPADTASTFDRTVMHSLSQFLSAFIHIKHLNSLLNLPLENGFMSRVYNGTFLYNFSKSLRTKLKPKDNVLELLKGAPSVFMAFSYLCEKLGC